MKRALVWTSLLLAMSATPTWAQSPTPRLQPANPTVPQQGIPGVTPRAQSADPKAAQQGIPGATPRFQSADPQTAQHGIPGVTPRAQSRSEEHTSELQSQSNLVCRLLLEKKKRTKNR